MEYSTLEHWQGIGETGIVCDLGSLYERFHWISDPRKAKGKRYSLVTLLVIIFMGKLCGKDKPMEIADWAKNNTKSLVELMNLKRDWMPSHHTIRRVFQSTLSESEFDRMAQEYSQQEQSGKGEVLALDGKVLRGTKITGQKASDQVLSLYDVKDRQVMRQGAVDIKENEIVVAPLITEGVPLDGKIITADALHTQRAFSQKIIDAGGHYVWPVKENQPSLYEAIQRLFAPDNPKPGFGKITTDFLTATKVNPGHGRLEKRTIQTSTMLNDYLDWPGVAQVYRLQREFSWYRCGAAYKKSSQIEYGITSLPRDKFSPAKLLRIRRSHWFVETGLHYRRDVTFREDATRMTIGSAGRILATVHNLVIPLLKRAGFDNAAQARRHLEGHLAQAFSLLITSSHPTHKPRVV